MPATPPFPDIDPEFCSLALRSVTDRLSRQAQQPGADEQIAAIVPRLFELAEKGRDMLKALLDPLYPAIQWGADEHEPELATDAISTRSWIYDPIDGAYHFLQGLPHWSASLALVERGEVIAAFVYDPTNGELFSAFRGAGASVNGVPITVSVKRTLGIAVVGTGLPIHGHVSPSAHAAALEQLGAVSRNVFVVRQMASASLQLAYVAAGRLDAYWEAGHDLHDWAAGALLVQEAGGITTDFSGAPFGGPGEGILAGPVILLDSLQSTIQAGRNRAAG